MFFYCVHLAKLDNGDSLGVKYTMQCVRVDVLVIAPYVLSAYQTAVVRHWAMGMASAPHPRLMGWDSLVLGFSWRLCLPRCLLPCVLGHKGLRPKKTPW